VQNDTVDAGASNQADWSGSKEFERNHAGLGLLDPGCVDSRCREGPSFGTPGSKASVGGLSTRNCKPTHYPSV
jgi:hypothetical protein